MKKFIFIVTVIILVLVISGIIFWQLQSKEEKTFPEEKQEILEEKIGEQTVLPEEEKKEKEEEEERVSISPTPTQITFLENLAADPSWSPDGSKIVFLSLEKDHMKGGLYTINSDGTEVTKIAG